jgi:hypothetical protein
MRAGGSVQARIGEHQSFDGLIPDNVGIDNLVHIGFLHKSIPDGVRVDDDGRAVFALFKAAGFIRADDVASNSMLRELLFEDFLQDSFAGRIAGPAWMTRFTLVGADEDVLLELRHASRLQQRG